MLDFDKRRFKAALALKDMTINDLAKEVGMNGATLYRKIGNDGDFSRDEISKLVEVLEIEDINSVFFCKETCE